jgi:hypothetical protein
VDFTVNLQMAAMDLHSHELVLLVKDLPTPHLTDYQYR